VFEGRWTAPRPGVFELEFELTQVHSRDLRSIRTTIVGELPQVETRAPWLDDALLTDLARLSGGRYVPWERLARSVGGGARPARSRGHFATPLVPCGTTGGCCHAFVGLLAAEWLVTETSARGLSRTRAWPILGNRMNLLCSSLLATLAGVALANPEFRPIFVEVRLESRLVAGIRL
jgi:hypothetical protein